jgi:uncharacterized membrane protein YfcA
VEALIEQLLLFAIAVVANLFSALAGGGAGLLQFPVLLFLGLPFAVALATHKIASVALGLGATLRHLRSSQYERFFFVFILLTGVPGVVLGAWLILDVPERPAEIALGCLTLSLGVYSWFKAELGSQYQPKRRQGAALWGGGLALFVIGVLNGSLASGTGLFVTMWLIRWYGMDYQRAVAYTLVTVGLVWNGSGAVALGFWGEVQWAWLPALIAGSLIGGYLGASLAIAKGNRVIKRSFEIITVAVGIKLLVG